MRKFTTTQKKSEWFNPFPDDKEVKIKVQPFSLIHLSKLPTESTFGVLQMHDVFMGCVLDWKGIVDGKDNKVMPCTEETKETVFDQDIELASLVVAHVVSIKLSVITEKESKNLYPLQNGQETKEEV